MSTSGATAHSKRLPSDAGHSQRSFDMEAASVKLRDRQRFFEEVLQHDVEIYLSTSHLHMDSKKPPVGSISSMEVNVDILEQMDLMEISDHEALDVFLNSGNDESVLTTTAQKEDDEDQLEDDDDDDGEVVFRQTRKQSKSRTSSTSSTSSQDNSEAVPRPQPRRSETRRRRWRKNKWRNSLDSHHSSDQAVQVLLTPDSVN